MPMRCERGPREAEYGPVQWEAPLPGDNFLGPRSGSQCDAIVYDDTGGAYEVAVV